MMNSTITWSFKKTISQIILKILKTKNEVILKTIIKSLKEIGIEIYDDKIIEALDFVYNFDHNLYDTLNKDVYSLKYIEYNDKLKDYKFYSTKYKEGKIRIKLK